MLRGSFPSSGEKAIPIKFSLGAISFIFYAFTAFFSVFYGQGPIEWQEREKGISSGLR